MKKENQKLFEKLFIEIGINCNKDIVAAAIDSIVNCFKNGNRLFIAGNGGSASDAEHIVGELAKSFNHRELSGNDYDILSSYDINNVGLADKIVPGLPAFSLNSQLSLITAMGNDVGFEYAFAQQVMAYVNSDDVVLLISTSGNSIDLINSAIVAKFKKAIVISLTGKTGGSLIDYSNLCVRANFESTPRIQEEHIKIYHLICFIVEKEMFDNE